MTKNSVCHAPYLRNHTSYDCHLCWKCVNWWYLQVFFFFSMLKYWFSRLSRGWMGKKWPKMTKISGTICCMILIYGTHMYKRIISPGIFLFFLKILIFRIIIGKSAKSGWKWEKILSVSLCISGVVHHMIIIFATYV